MQRPTAAQAEPGADMRERPSREEVARAALRSLGAPSFPPPPARSSYAPHGGSYAAPSAGTDTVLHGPTYERPLLAAQPQGGAKQAFLRDVPVSASPPPSPAFPLRASSVSHLEEAQSSTGSPASRMPSLSFSCSSRGSAPLLSPPEGGTELGASATARSEASIERVAAALHLRSSDVRRALKEQEDLHSSQPALVPVAGAATMPAADSSRPGSPGLDRETMRLVLQAMRAEDERVAQLASYRTEYLRAESLRMEIELQQQRQLAPVRQHEGATSMHQIRVPASPPPPYAPPGSTQSLPRLSHPQDHAVYAPRMSTPFSGAVMAPPDLPSEYRRLSPRRSERPLGATAAHPALLAQDATSRRPSFASLLQGTPPGLPLVAQQQQPGFLASTRTHRSMDDYALRPPSLAQDGPGPGTVGLMSRSPRPRSASLAQDLGARGSSHRQQTLARRDDPCYAMRSPPALSASPASSSAARRSSTDSIAGSKRPRAADEDIPERSSGRGSVPSGLCGSPEASPSLSEGPEPLCSADSAVAAQPSCPAPSHAEIMARLRDKVTARLAAKEQARAADVPVNVSGDSSAQSLPPPSAKTLRRSRASRPGSASETRATGVHHGAASHSKALEAVTRAATTDSTSESSQPLPAAPHAAVTSPSGGIEALLTAASLGSTAAEAARGDALAERAVRPLEGPAGAAPTK